VLVRGDYDLEVAEQVGAGVEDHVVAGDGEVLDEEDLFHAERPAFRGGLPEVDHYVFFWGALVDWVGAG
jgi:hypothetical protein